MIHSRGTRCHGLDRRKSTSSATGIHLEYIQPANAERDAHAAATLAFTRARQRRSTESTKWPPQRGQESVTPCSPRSSPGRSSHDEGNHSCNQSVRFVPSRTKSSRLGKPPGGSDAAGSPRPRSGTDDRHRSNTDGRPLSTPSAAGIVSAVQGTAGDLINALIAGEEYYTPEDDIASVPSSYRRIRKSRSMFTTSDANSYQKAPSPLTASILVSPATTQLPIVNENRDLKKGLRAPRSMSFLRSHPTRTSSLNIRGNGNSAISRGASQRSKSELSSTFNPGVKSKDRAFRKSLRDTSDTDQSPASIKISKDGSLRKKARKVSKTLKCKVKSLFTKGRGGRDDLQSIPPQRIESRKTYEINVLEYDNTMKSNSKDSLPTDGGSLSKVTSGVPSLHAVPSYQQLRSRKGSVDSLQGDDNAFDEKSRVTSWSNSETTSCGTMASQWGDWGKQRLSVIKENGTHVPSSSLRRPLISDEQIQKPAHHQASTSAPSYLPPPPPKAPVDSQRIYSALMKRLYESQQQTCDSESGDEARGRTLVNSAVVPLRGSSRDCLDKRNQPENANNNAGRCHASKGTVRIVNSPSSSDGSQITRTLSPSASAPSAGGLRAASPAGNESFSSWRLRQPRSQSSIRTVSARNSTFFGSPACHLFRTQSPYRRALQQSMKDVDDQQHCKSPNFNPWMRSLTSLPIGCPSDPESEIDKKMHYAESVYSSSTDEPTNTSRNTASLVEVFPRPPSTHGDATIFVDPVVYRPTPPNRSKHRVTSSQSSAEWKTWLSANVSKLEGSPSHLGDEPFQYTLPVDRVMPGHLREIAQISEEDESSDEEKMVPHLAGLSALKATGSVPSIVIEQVVPSQESSPSTGSRAGKAVGTSSTNDDHRSVSEKTISLRSFKLDRIIPRTPSSSSIDNSQGTAGRTSLTPFKSLNKVRDSHSQHFEKRCTTRLRRKQPRPLSIAADHAEGSPSSTAADLALAAAVDRQFGKVSTVSTDSKRRLTVPGLDPVKSENIDPNQAEQSYAVGEKDMNNAPASSIDSVSLMTSSSRRMVDKFLNTRRPRTVIVEDDGGVFL